MQPVAAPPAIIREKPQYPRVRCGEDVLAKAGQMYGRHPLDLAPLRYQQVTGSGNQGRLVGYAHNAQALMLGDAGNTWAVALMGPDRHYRAGIEAVAGQLPEGARVIAPEPDGENIARAWARLKGKPVKALGVDVHMSIGDGMERHVPRPHHAPLVNASALDRREAAEEMALIWWMHTRRRDSISDFEKLLSVHDAVLWRRNKPAESFHVFTPLAATHIMLGFSCGQPQQLPYLFSHLAHRSGTVSAMVDISAPDRVETLKAAGFQTARTYSTHQLG